MQNGKNDKNYPTTIVVFGATGDLFQNKLAPALFDLFVKGALPKDFRLIGFARRPFSNESFRDLIKESLVQKGRVLGVSAARDFLGKIFYHQGRLDLAEDYQKLGKFLSDADRKLTVCTNKLFYLAVPPDLYETIFDNLATSGLATPCAPGFDNERLVWTRILVEKPFGHNLATAKRLDQKLGKLFKEEQIFRIDHYLAKETIQNILSFRFSNSLFEPIWNAKQIESIEIKFHEKNLVSERGKFYDGVGALRDVGQNHMLQMLAVVAMENPKKLDANLIRQARAKLLKAVVSGGKRTKDYAIKGQYEGYLQENGVGPDSKTETFFRLKLLVKNRRWRGVPFYLEGGKALDSGKAEIVVYFKRPIDCLMSQDSKGVCEQNVLTFRIQPDEGIEVIFWAKKPGLDLALEAKSLSFKYREDNLVSKIPDAYERVLIDAIRGDQTLFASTQEVLAEWNLINPILEGWQTDSIYEYPKGSRGIDIGRIKNN
ncbi:MAG: glucose-6-phosphate dehydrogenase [Candidatus Paceibacterota bacterium]|jgi:glucose-6-phosphate 1-dehydrogenase